MLFQVALRNLLGMEEDCHLMLWDICHSRTFPLSAQISPKMIETERLTSEQVPNLQLE